MILSDRKYNRGISYRNIIIEYIEQLIFSFNAG